MSAIILVVVLSVCSHAYSLPFAQSAKKNCGFQSCHMVYADKLNVHLVPHSHDDVGWLKTVDQYYYGSNFSIQYAGVQHIIGSVVDALRSYPERRFIQVETAFFWRWWKLQSEDIKDVVRDLVNNGRLEIINGAWSMNDEAATHYHSIIDQFTWGLRIINDTLGECGRPKVGWQIDPFGHSREMASIFSQLGYDSMFFARLDYRDSILRHNTSTLEMIWQGSPNLGQKSNLFTGVLYDFYTTPANFCWDVLCSDIPINDDEESPDYNEIDIVNRFADYAIKGASHFETNHLLVTMGGDFTYQAAGMFYTNMDKLIKGFKKFRPDINVIYSTPSCYTKAVNDDSRARGISYSLKTDDFFPYASGTNSYWTGYFTSRPNSKRYERQGNNVLQVAKQLVTFEKVGYKKDYTANMTLLKEAMGMMQHHDAITGTEKQHVTNDYVRILAKAVITALSNVDNIVVDLLKKSSNVDVDSVAVNFDSCLMANVSICPNSIADRFAVVVYNPLSRPVSHYVRLPVNSNNFNITGLNGVKINYDITPAIKSFAGMSSSPYDLVFRADDIPALGLKYFYVDKQEPVTEKRHTLETRSIGSGRVKVDIDDETGLLSSVTLNGVTLPIKQEFMYYLGANGSNYGETNRSSGAYIFRPANVTPTALPFTDQVKVQIYPGNLVDEVHQEINSWIKQIIRVYKDEEYVEFDWVVGPLDISQKLGIEVISRFTTDLKTDKTFYTDSNGREMVKRTRNHRGTYKYTDEEPVSGNYYPVTSRISLKDVSRNIELAVLNDRAQGGSSLRDGQIELMVHRRLLKDDSFGVGEALNETEFGSGVIARGQHFLTFGPIETANGKTAAAVQRDLAQRKLLAPWTFIGKSTEARHSFQNLQQKLNFQFSGLKRSLPDNVQILTLEPWSDDRILLRLEHVFESNEDRNLSQSVEVDLNNLFTLFDIISIRETTLGANQWIEENEKLEWYIAESARDSISKHQDKIKYNKGHFVNDGDALKITLKPMEIRTFIVNI